MLNRKVRAYLSHPIRGTLSVISEEEREVLMAYNNEKAIWWGQEIRKVIGPNLDLYIPAEHEDFVMPALYKGFLTVNQVLEIDCEIVSQQDLLILANWELKLSEGMRQEFLTARELDIRVFEMKYFNDLSDLEGWIGEYYGN
jgi:hypothetical protein